MKILALLVAVYAPVMLLIHVSTKKILTAWNDQSDSWISLWFRPQRALLVEGMFWLLVLAAWPLWQPLILKVLVAAFSAVHFVIWAAAEFWDRGKGKSAFAPSPAAKRVIVAFDSVEACVIAALMVVAVLFLR